MTAHIFLGPDEDGDFVIGYPTPGAPHIFTVAAIARTKQGAQDECARLNEESTRAAAAAEVDYRHRIRGVAP